MENFTYTRQNDDLMRVHFVSPFVRNESDELVPNSGGLLITREHGSTTPKCVHSDSQCEHATTQPIVLDADGACVFYVRGSFDVSVKSASGYPVMWHSMPRGEGD